VAEKFRVCQSFLGAKLHDTKDPGADLSAMLHQVLGSVFALMQEYESIWRAHTGSEDVDLFGFRYDVGLDPVAVNVERMLDAFGRAREDLIELWSLALHFETLTRVQQLPVHSSGAFHLEDELWVRIVYDFACACRRHPLERGHLLRSFTPLYLARVASFVIETRDAFAAEVEEKIERLCLCFERWKPYLISSWFEDGSLAGGALHTEPAGTETAENVFSTQEVKS
jgi:glucosylglycerate synthase